LENVFLRAPPPVDRIEAGFEDVREEFKLLVLFPRKKVLSASMIDSSVIYAFLSL